MEKPRVYTAYHLYFSLLLEYLLKDHGYDVEPLVKVGKLPLEVDIIIIKRRQKSRINDFVQLDFLFQRLSDFNLIEFKGPTDTLTWKDYLHLTAVTDLYRIKIDHREKDDVRLFTIASTIPYDYRDFLSENGMKLDRISAGLYSLVVSDTYCHYILELNELPPDIKNELILFFSSKYHDKIGEIISYDENLITLFLLQELFQKERQKMRFKMRDEDLVVRDLQEVVSRLPLEWRLEGIKPKDRLKGLSPEDRLEGLKPEERLEGLKPEDRLEGLNPEEILKGLKPEKLKKLKKILEKLDLN